MREPRLRRFFGAVAQRRAGSIAMIVGALLPGAPEALADDGGSTTNRVLQMFGLGRGPNDAAKPPPTLAECPEIVVDGGSAEFREPPAADASNVRYQVAITRMARECALVGSDISVKVGIMGSAVLGPVGQPGAYFGNVRVALRRKRDEQLFGAKDYRVGATIPSGAARADFSLLVESIEAPFISQKAAEDYEVVVGFTQAAAAAAPKPEKKRHKPREGGE
ncbi:MAG: hypothetical protein WB816_04485 [Methylocystis sp.]